MVCFVGLISPIWHLLGNAVCWPYQNFWRRSYTKTQCFDRQQIRELMTRHEIGELTCLEYLKCISFKFYLTNLVCVNLVHLTRTQLLLIHILTTTEATFADFQKQRRLTTSSWCLPSRVNLLTNLWGTELSHPLRDWTRRLFPYYEPSSALTSVFPYLIRLQFRTELKLHAGTIVA